jgi:hypothetical protein
MIAERSCKFVKMFFELVIRGTLGSVVPRGGVVEQACQPVREQDAEQTGDALSAGLDGASRRRIDLQKTHDRK